MILRRLAAVLFLPLMVAFGSGVYMYLGTLKSKVVKEQAQAPTVSKPRFVLPGTMFVVQSGRLYKLQNGGFTEVGTSGDWAQPTITPDHQHLVAVLRGGLSSDLYLLDTNGNIVKRLTKNDSRVIDYDHWAFYPHISPDGQSVFYGYDSPKVTPSGYLHVDLSIWTMPLKGSQSQARRWSDSLWYTGGDVSPLPLPGGALIFVRHSIDTSTAVHSQLWYQSRPFYYNVGKSLTDPAADCAEPALSPDGTQLAMICSNGRQTMSLEVATLTGTTLGPPRVLLTGGLFAAPAWSPDGKALAYYAPVGAAGHFQLWYLAVPPPPTPPPSAASSASAAPVVFPTPSPSPVQVTEGVDLSATSPPVWY